MGGKKNVDKDLEQKELFQILKQEPKELFWILEKNLKQEEEHTADESIDFYN